MTESFPSPSAPNAEQLDRIAALQARRSGATAPAAAGALAPRPKRRRRHVAQGSRILAAGLGATTMLGIVTLLGLDNPVSGADKSIPSTVPVPVPPTPTAPMPVVVPPVEIVIHRVPASSPSSTQATGPEAIPLPAETIPAAPVELTANPVVRTVTVAVPSQAGSSSRASSSPAPAPAATTSGSS